MLATEQIQDLIKTYGDSLFPVPITTYLSTTNRVIWGLLINEDERQLEPYFGEIAALDMAQFNQNFINSLAGYRTRARDYFPNLTADADVFLISKQCLDLPLPEVEALVIHELCHWYIDSGLQSSKPLRATNMDRIMARGLYNKTDQNNDRFHTLPFCELLCSVANKATRAGAKFPNRKELVSLAMKYDVIGGFRV